LTAIVAGDIVYLLSSTSVGSGFSGTSTAGSSLGKFCTTSVISASLDNVFLDLTGAQNAASQVDYQCVFIQNNTASGNSMLNTTVWIPTASDNNVYTHHAFAIDPTGVTAQASASPQAVTIANNVTAPLYLGNPLTWVSPSATSSGGTNIGSVAPARVFAVWLRRTATNSVPFNSDGFTLEVDFDSQG
jgi:hypothetical protein